MRDIKNANVHENDKGCRQRNGGGISEYDTPVFGLVEFG